MSSPGRTPEPTVTAHYETLRETALRSDPVTHSAVGLGAFLLRGMAGWIEVLPALTNQADRQPAVAPLSASGRSGSTAQLIHILTNMLLACAGGDP